MQKQFKSQEKSALDELKKSRRRFKSKKKRETVLVRVQKKWHGPLKERAREKKQTLSKLHDEIYPEYLKQNSL
jgi:hypothetical protein